MSKATTDKTAERLEGLFIEPARAYGSLTLEYYEKLTSTQLDAARAYADLSLAQIRAWLEVKDPESFKKVVEGQPQVAQELGARVKDDAEKLISLSQEYLQKGQKLVDESIKVATSAK